MPTTSIPGTLHHAHDRSPSIPQAGEKVVLNDLQQAQLQEDDEKTVRNGAKTCEEEICVREAQLDLE